ncbi:MAG: hypothetical protein ACOX9C_12125 [Kiritimatiellia bacterium]|jgi:hypothetical protein
MKLRILPATLMLAALMLGGCATKIKVTSEPSGAMVRLRGEGRAAFRWKTGPTVTPCEMDVYYGRVSVYVIWPDIQPDGQPRMDGKRISGVKSEKRQIDLSPWRDEESIHFVKP